MASSWKSSAASLRSSSPFPPNPNPNPNPNPIQLQPPPPPPPHQQQGQESEEAAAALSISDQRTLYLVNMFIGNTVRFLNSFSSLCEHKLSQLHRRILHVDATLSLLEAKLRNMSPCTEFDNNNCLEATGPSSQAASE